MAKRGRGRKKKKQKTAQVAQTQAGALEPTAAKVRDLRHVLSPYSAARLRERKTNQLRDFLHVAPTLGVTHFLILTQTTMGTNLRVLRVPRGPTLTFRVLEYSLASDVVSQLKRPQSLPALLKQPPLVVLSNFSASSKASQAAAAAAAASGSKRPRDLELLGAARDEGAELADDTDAKAIMVAMLRNMFPTLQVNEAKLSECRRVVLWHYVPEDRSVEMRHYAISAQPLSLSKNIQKLSKQNRPPDLSGLQDVSEMLLNPEVDLNDGDSDDEMRGAPAAAPSASSSSSSKSAVTLPQDMPGIGNKRARKSALKLTELGPRLKLGLLKIEEEVCTGRVIYHSFVSRTREESEAAAKAKAARERERRARREEQEANVERKVAKKEEKKARREERRRERELQRRRERGEDVSEEEDEEDERRRGLEQELEKLGSFGDLGEEEDMDWDAEDGGFMGGTDDEEEDSESDGEEVEDDDEEDDDEEEEEEEEEEEDDDDDDDSDEEMDDAPATATNNKKRKRGRKG